MSTGKPIGVTDDPEGVFVAAVEHAAAREPVFVVLGTGERDDRLAERIGDRCPIIRDAELMGDDEAAIIVAGNPDEWEAMRKPT